jgi:23S rRNA (guanine745-N1)-methyltransferase
VSACIGVLTCPVCGGPLTQVGSSLRCERSHSFDQAKEGYFHLLPAGHGQSKLQGDTREMITARRRFLEGGHYEPLSSAINAFAQRHLDARSPDGKELVAVEVGCGDGYYIGGLARALSQTLPEHTSCFFGVDLSKEALRRAARTHAQVRFLVNDVHHRLCFADGSVDLLLNIFAPRNATEFERIVATRGWLLVAIPRDDHLNELRTKLPLIGIDPQKWERTVDQLKGFELETHERLEYDRTLGADQVTDLMRMTPNYWHIDEAILARVADWDPVQVTVAVDLLGFRRRGSEAA